MQRVGMMGLWKFATRLDFGNRVSRGTENEMKIKDTNFSI